MAYFNVDSRSSSKEFLCVFRRAKKELANRKGLTNIKLEIDSLICKLTDRGKIQKGLLDKCLSCSRSISNLLSPEVIKSVNANLRKTKSRECRGSHSLEVNGEVYKKLNNIKEELEKISGASMSLIEVIGWLIKIYGFSRGVNPSKLIRLYSEVEEVARIRAFNDMSLGKGVSLEKFLEWVRNDSGGS